MNLRKHAFQSTLTMLLATGVGIASPALSADSTAHEKSSGTLSSNIALASQYVARGFQMTWGDPAVQGGFDYARPGGFFSGTWLSSISPKFIQDGYLEWDIYAGYGAAVGPVSLKSTLYYYLYPDAQIRGTGTASGNSVKYDYGELQLGATWKWVTVNYWYTYTQDCFGYDGDTLFDSSGAFYRNGKHSRGSSYTEAILNYEIGNGYSALARYGYQRIKNFEDWDSADYKIGFTKIFDSILGSKGWSISVNYTGVTKANDYYRNKNTAVPFASLTGDGSTSRPVDDQFIAAIARTF